MPGISAPNAVNYVLHAAQQAVTPQQKFLKDVENNELTFKQIHETITSKPDFLPALATMIEQHKGSSTLVKLGALIKFDDDTTIKSGDDDEDAGDLERILGHLVGNPSNRRTDGNQPTLIARLTDEQQHAFIALIALPECERTAEAFYNAGVFTAEVEEENCPIFELMTNDTALYDWLESGFPSFESSTPAYPLNLSYAAMSGSELNHYNFRGCNMKGADLDSVSAYKCDFRGCDLTDATIFGGSIEDCNGKYDCNDLVKEELEEAGLQFS